MYLSSVSRRVEKDDTVRNFMCLMAKFSVSALICAAEIFWMASIDSLRTS